MYILRLLKKGHKFLIEVIADIVDEKIELG